MFEYNLEDKLKKQKKEKKMKLNDLFDGVKKDKKKIYTNNKKSDKRIKKKK